MHEAGDASKPNRYHINRVEALDEVMQRFHHGLALLPREARGLGGRVKDGLGDYYRQLVAPKRTLEQDAQGNWVSRWVDNGKADHYAHAELYCMMAEHRDPRIPGPWSEGYRHRGVSLSCLPRLGSSSHQALR